MGGFAQSPAICALLAFSSGSEGDSLNVIFCNSAAGVDLIVRPIHSVCAMRVSLLKGG